MIDGISDSKKTPSAARQDDSAQKSKSVVTSIEFAMALQSLRQNGLALRRYPRLKADKDVVLTAVSQNGMALEYASEELKADKDVVLAAVRLNGWQLLNFAY